MPCCRVRPSMGGEGTSMQDMQLSQPLRGCSTPASGAMCSKPLGDGKMGIRKYELVSEL